MSDSPPSETALSNAIAAGRYAASFGFDWPHASDALPKVEEEARELATAIAQGQGIAEELGDLLFAACNVARLLDIDPDVALRAATQKFEHRFRLVLERVSQRGQDPRELSLDELEEVWLSVK